MTKSTITREQLEEWVAQFDEDGGCDATDRQLEALIRQSLAAMDSEPVEMPLDYLQGHKDGLEWASQLAEANHPETGDWLYDDPIELAKAIRKGQDMPPVQPVADSEPDRNPVLAYADSYRDMAKQGVESVPIWSVITDIERNIAPLYRHAQPAPVVPEEAYSDDCPELYPSQPDAWAAGWNACRAAMLAAAPQPQNEPQNIPEIIPQWIPVSEGMPKRGDYLVTDGRDFDVQTFDGEQFIPGFVWDDGITHWMPLPAAPQEAK